MASSLVFVDAENAGPAAGRSAVKGLKARGLGGAASAPLSTPARSVKSFAPAGMPSVQRRALGEIGNRAGLTTPSASVKKAPMTTLQPRAAVPEPEIMGQRDDTEFSDDEGIGAALDARFNALMGGAGNLRNELTNIQRAAKAKPLVAERMPDEAFPSLDELLGDLDDCELAGDEPVLCEADFF